MLYIHVLYKVSGCYLRRQGSYEICNFCSETHFPVHASFSHGTNKIIFTLKTNISPIMVLPKCFWLSWEQVQTTLGCKHLQTHKSVPGTYMKRTCIDMFYWNENCFKMLILLCVNGGMTLWCLKITLQSNRVVIMHLQIFDTNVQSKMLLKTAFSHQPTSRDEKVELSVNIY